MQPVKRCILRAGSAAFRTYNSGVRFLLFHEIKESQLRDFESLIRFVREKYGFIAPEEYGRCSQMNGIRYIVSFDDGFTSQIEVTREVLNPVGIKAIFFVCPGFIGLQGKRAADFITGPMARSDVSQMTSELQPLSWEDLTSLSSTGHVIGSHGMNHARLSDLRNESNLTEEIVSSGDELEMRLGRQIDWFAYSFGDIASVDSRSLRIIERRYKYCCSGLRGINTEATHRLCLARENIDFDEHVDDLKRIANGGLDHFYYFKRKKLLKMAESC